MAMYQPPYMMGQQYGYMPQAPMQMPQLQTAQQPQQTGAGIIWVQGEQAAKSYLVAAGNSVLLMDSDAQRFYLKTADASGMPMPLRVFEYKEVTGQQIAQPVGNTDQFVTRKEFDEFRAMMTKEAKQDGEPAV